MNPAIHPRYRLGAKIPPQPPPPLVALEANTLDQAKIQLQKLFNDLGISYKDNPKSKQSRAMESIQNSLN